MFHYQCLLQDGSQIWLEDKHAHVDMFHDGKLIVGVGTKMDTNELMKFLSDGVMGERFIPLLC